MSDTSSPPVPSMGLGFQSTNDPNMIQAQAQLQAALSAPIPRFYINGIGIAMTGSETLSSPRSGMAIQCPL